jgi:hypothetical protein
VTALSFYSVVVAFHVIVVVIALGSAFMFPILGVHSRKNPQHTPFALGVTKFTMERIVFPGYALIMATGIYQSIDQDWFDRDQVIWLHVSMALFLLIIALGTLVAYPAVKKALRVYESATADGGQFVPTPEFLGLVKRQKTVGPIMGLSIIAITFLMEAKPF